MSESNNENESDNSYSLEKPKKITGNNKERTEKQKEAFKKCLEKRNEKLILRKKERLQEIAELNEIKELLREKKNMKTLKKDDDDIMLKEVLEEEKKEVKKTLTRTKPKKVIVESDSEDDSEEEIPIKRSKKMPVNITINNEIPKSPVIQKPKAKLPLFV
jgi:hypothetical protein